jgi:electron transport complex protein RnfB
LIADHHAVPDESMRIAEQNDLRNRYYSHIQREEKQRINRKDPVVRANIDTELFAQFTAQNDSVPDIVITSTEAKPTVHLDAKSTIELAKIRTQIKKLEKQLSVREDAKKRLQLDELNQQLNTLQGA